MFSKCLLGVKQEGACKSSTAFFEEFRIQGSVRVLQGLFILLEGVLLEFHEGLFSKVPRGFELGISTGLAEVL